jgi:Tfp pilus assembly protein PilN
MIELKKENQQMKQEIESLKRLEKRTSQRKNANNTLLYCLLSA